jgi:hypothetical protein
MKAIPNAVRVTNQLEYQIGITSKYLPSKEQTKSFIYNKYYLSKQTL